jgi:hypothetical protein
MLSLALLEVMDKEPSLPGIWIGAAIFGGLGFWTGLRWIWPGVLLLVVDLIALSGQHAELADPYVGPAILEEAGRGYVVQSYVASALVITATVAGIVLGVIERKRHKGVTGRAAAPGAVI